MYLLLFQINEEANIVMIIIEGMGTEFIGKNAYGYIYF
jgi:hypothetical protein